MKRGGTWEGGEYGAQTCGGMGLHGGHLAEQPTGGCEGTGCDSSTWCNGSVRAVWLGFGWWWCVCVCGGGVTCKSRMRWGAQSALLLINDVMHITAAAAAVRL